MTTMTSEEARQLLALARESKPAPPISGKLLADALTKLMSGALHRRVAAESYTQPYHSIEVGVLRSEIGVLSILAILTWLGMVWNWRAG